ncbi:AaceriAAR065Cp [[Ashbya] aceris (nom. inval.)]|nr:AaceriAAR065Cp [[Ashbya] aceris (nom. inval.)]
MARVLANNKDFLRIQELNADGERERRSLYEDQLEAVEEEECLEGCAQTVVITAAESKSAEKARSATAERRQTPPPWYTSALMRKERLRFRQGSGEMQSLLRDVQFQCRGTIMDAFVNDPLRIYFSGPCFDSDKNRRLEAEMLAGQEMVRGVALGDGGQVTVQTVTTNFSGFYVLFWLAVAFALVKVTAGYYIKNDGNIMQSEIVHYMTTDLWRVAWFDLLMYLCTYFVFGVQWMCRRGWLRWAGAGWLLTSAYELLFFAYFTYVAEHTMRFKWISKIFLFLHSCVLVMKMHSYAFYNGYLWQILDELHFSRESLALLKDLDEEVDESVIRTLEKSEEFCQFELNSQSTSVPFPSNITLDNYFMYSMFPTVVYQISYPRTDKIRWTYFVEKLAAIAGIIFIMMVVAQLLIYPVTIKAMSLRESGMSFSERAKLWPNLLIEVVPGFIIMYLLVWYLIWDAILNCIAELTRFGDRYFYGDWWNCVNWGDFSRLWNVPVHKFLLRHVYHSSLSAFCLSTTQATFMTFILSSLVHELAMYVIFGKLRFYLFLFQMAQLPLMALNNSKLLHDKKVLLNVLFWFGICTGPSVICTIYLTF